MPTRYPAVVWAMPFGFAVVPDVYIRNSRSSESIGSQGHDSGSSGLPSTTSFQKTSRPRSIETSPSVRRRTTQVSMPGASPIASSAICFSGTLEPRRHASSWVTSTVQPMSLIRPESESAEKPPKTTVCGAPNRVQASIAIASSGTMPM